MSCSEIPNSSIPDFKLPRSKIVDGLKMVEKINNEGKNYVSARFALNYCPWVELSETSIRNSVLLRDMSKPRLRPLKIDSWQFEKNAEFAKLFLVAARSSSRTVARYVDRYSLLGHSHNLKLILGDREFLIPRPICTDNGATSLTFEFIIKVVAIEFLGR